MSIRRVSSACVVLVAIVFTHARVDAAKVMYILGNELGMTEGNDAVISIFEGRGDEIELWDNALLQADPGGALDAADEADLVFIDESVSSGRADAVIDTVTPVINNEQYAFDNWGMTGLAIGHGSPGRPNGNGDIIVGGSHFGTTVEIVDATHPIAVRAGLSGLVQVYEDIGGRIDWGKPGPEANVVAQIPGYAEHQPAAAVFVYEEGSALFDGSIAPAMRIGFFISDTNRGPEPDDPDVVDDGSDGSWEGNEATLLTAAGIALLNSTIDYALGIANAPGDFNGNGVLDIDDLNQLGLQSASMQNDLAFDLTADNLVNRDDVNFWVKDLKNTWIGDANLDGEFNSADFVAVFQANKFEQNVEAVWAEGDWDGDARFGSGDFVVAFQDSGFEMGPRGSVSAVPEPCGLCLALAGFVALVRLRGKSNKSAGTR